jgi:hypothetical protein
MYDRQNLRETYANIKIKAMTRTELECIAYEKEFKESTLIADNIMVKEIKKNNPDELLYCINEKFKANQEANEAMDKFLFSNRGKIMDHGGEAGRDMYCIGYVEALTKHNIKSTYTLNLDDKKIFV